MHRISNGSRTMEYSSKFALSENLVLRRKDRAQLMGLLSEVIQMFRDVYLNQNISAVDLEFKMLEVPKGKKKDVVMVKQIRPLAKRTSS